ncbi:hypothetical protein ABID30_002021 [Enterococcus rotai]|uniref:Uncharacterized protein n=1 Tax=Enterococcus rotai TaxID=118060 RepID=A0A0U2VQU6_9ENTE|nr:DUF916 and DUF3324 domain-containing protein [Enterococcus rotai]ALS36783.1 hypothetical protein ATZ35_06320 [Enterococcus rotai]
MRKNHFYPVVVFLIFLFIHPVDGFSAEDVSSVISDFSYEILYPENQKDKTLGYYDLLMKQGEEQQIQLQLNNASNQPMQVAIAISSAKTNGNGVVTFGPNDIKTDASLKHDLAKLMTAPEKVTIAPNDHTVVDFTISVPDEAFDGYIAGGIQLKPIVKEQTSIKKDQVILNKFAFVIGVLLSESEIQYVQPDLQLNDVSLKLKNARYTLFANISNTKSNFAEDLMAKIKIRKKGEKKAFLEVEKEKMRMAPNSMMELPIFLEDQKVTAGEYAADVELKSKNGQSWKWVRNFALSKLEAERINKQKSIQDEVPRNHWWLILGILFIFLVVGGLCFLYFKKISK